YDLAKGDHPLLGRRMPPDRTLTLPDGTRTRVAELLRTGRGLLLTTDRTTAGTAREHTGHLDVVTATWTAPPDPALDTVLIRPDGYVAWTSPGTTDDLTDALHRWFGSGVGQYADR
ncbi:monooxygenase, partial [Streptomyces sp. SID5789]|nr:monooxygenase [Streptomyces sp. SID5789]